MGIFIYKLNNDKIAEIQKSTELQSQVNILNGTVSRLQEKIDNISETINNNSSAKNTTTTNTSNNITTANEYDIEISMSELENVNYSNNAQLKNLEDKYRGKIVKITGYVSNFGDDDIETRKNIYKYRKQYNI